MLKLVFVLHWHESKTFQTFSQTSRESAWVGHWPVVGETPASSLCSTWFTAEFFSSQITLNLAEQELEPESPTPQANALTTRLQNTVPDSLYPASKNFLPFFNEDFIKTGTSQWKQYILMNFVSLGFLCCRIFLVLLSWHFLFSSPDPIHFPPAQGLWGHQNCPHHFFSHQRKHVTKMSGVSSVLVKCINIPMKQLIWKWEFYEVLDKLSWPWEWLANKSFICDDVMFHRLCCHWISCWSFCTEFCALFQKIIAISYSSVTILLRSLATIFPETQQTILQGAQH